MAMLLAALDSLTVHNVREEQEQLNSFISSLWLIYHIDHTEKTEVETRTRNWNY